MWKIFSRFLNRTSSTPPITARPKASLPDILPCQTGLDSPLELLWQKVAKLSKHDRRFIHPNYSPSSRVPCADFTSFIVDRLRNNDINSIQHLMRTIISGNPGLGTGPEWINKPVNEIANIDITRYFYSVNKDFQFELKSLFILGSKDGGGREYWYLVTG